MVDPQVLGELKPSLLVFASIGFSVLISVPTLRDLVRSRLATKIVEGPMPTTEFFWMSFYIDFTHYLYVIAFLYLTGTWLLLLSPLQLFNSIALANLSYGVILLATTILFVLAVILCGSNFRKALLLSRVYPARAP